ncbi:hypothetical protein [Dyella japonica]|uniref:hypothetical protein n=1 Tax=Dyella japonica TaxID=231455 RepID=UPI00030011EF|nr:hypothetical protein [Dyella japonica]
MTTHVAERAQRASWVAMEVAAHGGVSYNRGPLESLTGGGRRPESTTLRVLWRAGSLTKAVISQLDRIADHLVTRNVHAHARRVIEGYWSTHPSKPHLYFLYERNGQRVSAVPVQDREETALSWAELHLPDHATAETGVLIELLRSRSPERLEAVWEELRHTLDLALTPPAAEMQVTTTDPTVVIQTDPAEARRARLLALGWPTSAEVAARVGSQSRNAGQWAKDKRDAGQLLGVWDATVRTFRHPDFQFEADGQLRPEVKDLLAALADHPDWTSETDTNGWRRAYWLYQPFRSLSRAALAFATLHPEGQGSALNDSPEGALEYLQSLREAYATPEDQRARTPAEVFVEQPAAVIAHARQAAAAALPGFDAEGNPRAA